MDSSSLVSVRDAITQLQERGFRTWQDGDVLYAQLLEDAEIPFTLERGGVDRETLRVVLAREDGEFEDDYDA